MRRLTFENTRTLINTVSIGKKYLVDIIKQYEQENNKDIISELEHIILTIGNKDTVDNFYLHNDLRELFNNEDTYSELAEKLNRYLVLYDNLGICLMYHII